METRFDFEEETNTCIIYLAADMCEEESDVMLDTMKTDEKIQDYDKFIVVIPESFIACEEFRIKIHRIILARRKSNPRFRMAIVTTLLNVIGYEEFARTVIGMVNREQIFETLDEAVEWIQNE